MSKQDEYKAKQKLQSKVLLARDIKREQKAQIKKRIEKEKREEWEKQRKENGKTV